jgi:nicotinamidase-related amidase
MKQNIISYSKQRFYIFSCINKLLTMEKKSALLIIDMQKGSFTPDTPRYNSPEVIATINSLAKTFRSHGDPVIFIQHDGSRFNEYLPKTSEWEILDELIIEKSDLIISKTVNDAFYNSKLDQTLQELGIQEVVITGCATDFCVESTVQNALTKDYSVTIVSDAHTTADRPHVNAKALIDHYNYVWEDLFPTKGEIRVIRSSDLIL